MILSVQYLHDQCRIIHADIKPNNFILESNEPNSSLRLIDFGLSAHFPADGACLEGPVGTLGYMAPEVRMGEYDHRCDIWSLGVCAKRLLTGERYRDQDHSYTSIFSKAMQKRLSHNARDFVEQMLKADPEERISLADALKHPFLVENCLPRQQLALKAINSIASFKRLEKPQQFLLLVISKHLKPEQIKELPVAFHELDEDNSGTISIKEIEDHLSKFGKKIKSAMRKYNDHKDDSAEINYSQFVAAALCQSMAADEGCLRAAFDLLDPKKNGYLDIGTLKGFMGTDMGERVANQLVSG
jgi:calcium-dependent protein kinase